MWKVNWSKWHERGTEKKIWVPVPEVIALIPVRDSDFFFVSRSYHVDQFTFHISLPSLKFTIFTILYGFVKNARIMLISSLFII